MKNLELAKIFYAVADILEIKEVEWKPAAYRKAARSLEALSDAVEEIYEEEGLKGLDKIPGIGKRISEKIVEYIKTGKIKENDKLKKSLPKHLLELMDVQGIGPKRAKVLYKKLGIKSIKELERAAKLHKIERLPLFKEKLEKDILEGIEIYKGGQGRHLLGLILPIAKEIEGRLRKLKEVDKAEIAGSTRRMKETVRDVDILVATKNPKRVIEYFTSMPEIKKVLAKGSTKSTIILENNLQIDIRVVDEKVFGSALQYFTGSKEHSISLRRIALKKGYKLSEYGLFKRKGNRLIACRNEEEVYKNLGMQYIPPELRENIGEIEIALQHKIPRLVELKDIKGDMHVHSKYSDGSNSIAEIANAAKKLKYEYICISDHSKGMKIANGMTEAQLLRQIKEIDKLNDRAGIKILKGAEVNIKKDGSLDYTSKILKKLDAVTASIHYGLSGDQTKRILRAMDNEYVNIIGHPTGRLIDKRAGSELEFDKVFEKAKSRDIALEINAFPDRLDLNDKSIKEAVERGVMLAIGSDSHNIEQLRFMKLGVAQARRGWAAKKNILNCMTVEQLNRALKR